MELKMQVEDDFEPAADLSEMFAAESLGDLCLPV
jgi:hypothetical protein